MYKNLNKYVVEGKNMNEHVKCFLNHFVYNIYQYHYNLLFAENSLRENYSNTTIVRTQIVFIMKQNMLIILNDNKLVFLFIVLHVYIIDKTKITYL